MTPKLILHEGRWCWSDGTNIVPVIAGGDDPVDLGPYRDIVTTQLRDPVVQRAREATTLRADQSVDDQHRRREIDRLQREARDESWRGLQALRVRVEEDARSGDDDPARRAALNAIGARISWLESTAGGVVGGLDLEEAERRFDQWLENVTRDVADAVDATTPQRAQTGMPLNRAALAEDVKAATGPQPPAVTR